MLPRWPLLFVPLALLGMVAAGFAQPAPVIDSAEDAQAALARTQDQGAQARRRAERLEAGAASASAAAERSAQEAAALAARVQEAEAQLDNNAAQLGVIAQQQARLRAALAAKQQPVVELTAALQRLSRRPPLLSLLRPGSLQETVYLRAVLETLLPEVARRTTGLRDAIDQARRLEAAAHQANTALRTSQGELTRRQALLQNTESRQRITSREASVAADQESARALALSEQARDLTALVGDLAKAGTVRSALAALPGPVLRPAQPQAAQTPGDAVLPPAPDGAPGRYLLPVAGRLVAGFGDARPGQAQSRGLSIAAPGGAQVIAPGAGRIAFAGRYQGYGLIVIIEHPGGWTSLVTGLTVLDCQVGEQLVAGSPLGQAGPGRPVLTLELRRGGDPVNPLDFVKN